MHCIELISSVAKRLTKKKRLNFWVLLLAPLGLIAISLTLTASYITNSVICASILGLAMAMLLAVLVKFAHLLKKTSNREAARLLDDELRCKERFLTIATLSPDSSELIAASLEAISTQGEELSKNFVLSERLPISLEKPARVSACISPIFLLVLIALFWMLPAETKSFSADLANHTAKHIEQLKQIANANDLLPSHINENLLELVRAIEEDGIISEEVANKAEALLEEFAKLESNPPSTFPKTAEKEREQPEDKPDDQEKKENEQQSDQREQLDKQRQTDSSKEQEDKQSSRSDSDEEEKDDSSSQRGSCDKEKKDGASSGDDSNKGEHSKKTGKAEKPEEQKQSSGEQQPNSTKEDSGSSGNKQQQGSATQAGKSDTQGKDGSAQNANSQAEGKRENSQKQDSGGTKSDSNKLQSKEQNSKEQPGQKKEETKSDKLEKIGEKLEKIERKAQEYSQGAKEQEFPEKESSKQAKKENNNQQSSAANPKENKSNEEKGSANDAKQQPKQAENSEEKGEPRAGKKDTKNDLPAEKPDDSSAKQGAKRGEDSKNAVPTSKEAERFGPFDGGEDGSLDVAKAKKTEVTLPPEENIIVRHLGGADPKQYENKSEAVAKTKLGTREFKKPSASTGKLSQPIPVEYSDILR